MTLQVGGVPEHFNLPWHLAIAADGIDVAWHDQPAGTGAMMAALADGSLDLAVALTEGVVAAIDDGLAAEVVGVHVASPLQWGIHTGTWHPARNETELAGARIAISRFGSGSHLMAYVLADRLGWTLADDQFVVVGGLDGAMAAFAAGEVDLFLWDRYMTQALVDAGACRRVGVQPTPWPCFVVAARTDILAARGAEVHDVLAAVAARATALHDRPDVIDLLVGGYHLDEATARAWLDTTEFAPAGPVDPAMLAEVRRLLANARRSGGGGDA